MPGVVPGVVPDKFKNALASPTFKLGLKDNLTNYYSISILLISKILRRAIVNKLNKYFNK